MTATTYNPLLYIDGYSAPPTPRLYHVNVQGVYSQAQLEDGTNAVNQTGKTTGKKVWDATNKRVMVAEGPLPGDDWIAANGSGSLSPIGGSSYALVADVRSYSLTGNAANFKRALRMTAATGAFALTGNDALLSSGVRMTADAGSFVLTGNDAGLKRALRMTAETGAFAFTGNAANLNRGLRMTAAQGAFTLTGNNAGLTVAAGSMESLSGDAQSGTDDLLLSGDAQSGTDNLKLSGDAA